MILNSKAMRRAAVAASAASMLVLTACSSDGGSDSGSEGGTAAGGEGRGPITIVEGQDPLNTALESIIADWNAEHPDEQVTFKPLGKEADQQRDDITQRMQAQSDEYDLIAVDVTNTAEFAANGWLRPLEGDYAIETDGCCPPRSTRPPTTAPCTRRRRTPTARSCTTARTWSTAHPRRGRS